MLPPARRSPIVGRYTGEELALATRNRGMPLEALRHERTPDGLHYLLVHFDIPYAQAESWRLAIEGLVERPQSFSVAELRAMPSRTLRLTMECAGNGRAQMSPRYPSVPWLEEGVSTADWTGVPLSELLRIAGLGQRARALVFYGADRGIDRGIEHPFARSLACDEALRDGVLLAYEMNGATLAPQHGHPLRLVVPRWYGMASVKWLERIEAIEGAYAGVQQTESYHFRGAAGERGEPCTLMRVNSLLVPPGIPDFYTRERVVAAGPVDIIGRAWSGSAPVERVEFGVDGDWSDARLQESSGEYCWRAWRAQWQAQRGAHELSCRATAADGQVQPLEPQWDVGGFGNHAVQRVRVVVP